MRSLGPVTALAALSVFAPLASAGVAAVINHCNKPFYLWSVGDEQSDQVILPNDKYVYNETYYTKSDYSGVSIKICGEPVLDNDKAMQVEYTLGKDGKLWYDFSNVNDQDKLWDVDYDLTTTDPDCPAVHCKANEKCKDVYNNWDDNAATHECSATSDLIFTLCPNGGNGKTGGSASGSAGGSKLVVDTTASKDTTDSAPRPIQFASGKTTHADIYVSPEGKLVGDAVKVAEPSSPPAPSFSPVASVSHDTSSGGDDTVSEAQEITYLHPKFPGKSSKRSVNAHLHEHAQHSRLRRSRVFRQ